MELIIINENKLKIMLSCEDMKKYGLDEKDVDYSFPYAKKALKSILSDVKIETGFDTENKNDRIFIQLYPSLEGGCEMFVTKIDLMNSDVLEDETLMPIPYKEANAPQTRAGKKPATIKKNTLTYRFDKIEWVSCACRELERRGFSGESELFRDRAGRYYLFLTAGLGENEKHICSSFISEFGTLESTEHTRLYLNENGTVICQDSAVEVMSRL